MFFFACNGQTASSISFTQIANFACVQLVATGTLRAQFDAEQKIELFEFLTTRHEEYVARKHVIEAAKPAHEWVKEWRSLNTMDGKQSPEMSKKGKSRQLKSPQKEPPGVLVDLPDSAVNSKGVTEAVHQFLEVCEYGLWARGKGRG